MNFILNIYLMKRSVVFTIAAMVLVVLIGLSLFLTLRARMISRWEAVDTWTEVEMLNMDVERKLEETSNRIIAMDSSQKSRRGEQVEEIKDHTLPVLRFLNESQEGLEAFAEIDPATLEPMNKRETELNYRYWMFPEETSGSGETDLSNGGRGAGKAIELKAVLDDYVDWSNEYLSVQHANDIATEIDVFDSLAPDEATDEPNSTWEYRTFGSKGFMDGRTLVENLLTLSRLRLEIATMHHEHILATLSE